jgi:NAD-dependent deacetylase
MDQVRGWLKSAGSIAVLTGAGVSAESGIPTFRGPGGLWRQYRPEELATPQAFARDPKLVWEWYDWRRGLIALAEPNAGHVALAQIEALAQRDQRDVSFTLITQNVDGLHDRAGSRNILKVHGDIWTLWCSKCAANPYVDRRPALPNLPPLCDCGAPLRPGVVWFGEALPRDVWTRAEEAAREANVFLVIGTSAVVYPAAGLVQLAKQSGAKVVEINPVETAVSSMADVSLRGLAAELVPQLLP